jgi:hypothetical protein
MARVDRNPGFHTSKKDVMLAVDELMVFLPDAKVLYI